MANGKEGGPSRKQGRVLFTGSGEMVIDSVCKMIPDNYLLVRSPAKEEEFISSIKKIKPHVVVICLQNETRDTLRCYSCLSEEVKFNHIPVIAVGRAEDCMDFRSKAPIKKLETLIRPLNREGFLETLHSFMDESQTAEEAGDWPKDLNSLEELADEEDDMLNMKAAEKALVRKIQMLTRIHGRKSILVVDDDVQMLNVIKLYLQDLYDVTVVPSGKLALKFIAKKAADLVLLDYIMPEMDGPAVLKEIRENSAMPTVPVIFLTGVSDKDCVLRCLELKPNGYMLKPVSREKLLEKVTEIVLGL